MSSGRCSGLDNITSHQPPRLLSLRKANLYDWLLLFAFSRSMTPNVRSPAEGLFWDLAGMQPCCLATAGTHEIRLNDSPRSRPSFRPSNCQTLRSQNEARGLPASLLHLHLLCSHFLDRSRSARRTRHPVHPLQCYNHRNIHTPGNQPTQCGNNGTYDLHIGDDMPLYVGVNPPWDPNPFFFWFGRINFKTSAFICYQDGQPCASTTFWPWYYVHAQLLDLSRATVKVVQNSTGSMYRVTGDQGSFVSNGTEFDPALFFTAPTFPINQTRGTGMRDPAGCVLTESINW